VDDDLKLRRLLVKFLGDQGFRIREFPDGSGLLAAVAAEEPAAVILDIMMPGENGLQILARLRGQSRVPVLMLTAKGDDEDRITGLERGADDYLPKPFNPRELVARINSVLRRSTQAPGSAAAVLPESSAGPTDDLRAGGLVLHRSRRSVSAGGDEVELSATEFRILEALMIHPSAVLSRDQLLSYARGKDLGPFDRSIDVHISKLRAKTEQVSGGRRCIRTVWGSGYRFDAGES
jgi:two-component system phosphate regulon response regulator OmpR